MSGKKDSPRDGSDRLLVIRLSAMGDVAICVPVLLALTRKYTGLRITVLSKPAYCAFFEDIAGVDFYAAEVKGKHKGLRGLYRLFTELKKQKIDGVADLHGVIRSHVLGGFFRSVGIPLAKIDKGRRDKKAMTRPGNKGLRPLKTTYQRYVDVFKKLGYTIDTSQDCFLPKKELPPAIASLFNDDPNLHYVGIAPFAAHPGKQYPLELMRKVIEKLEKPGNHRIFLFGGGRQETEMLKKLAQNFKNTYCVAGQFTFPEELAIISNLHVMLAMDSGNGHLAAMYGVPVVTLWGVTHPYLGFTPYAQPRENQLMADREKFPLIPTSVYGNKLPEGYDRAIETITPENIVAFLGEKLKKK